MGRRALIVCVACVTLLVGEHLFASASSMRRELRRMTGYTIISADSVAEVSERDDGKYVRLLLSGTIFKLDGYVLAPLVATDVVVFAKPVPDDLKRRFPSLPPPHFYFYKLLIDDEIADATFVR